MNHNIKFKTANEDFYALQNSGDNDFCFDLDTQLNDMTENSEIENDRIVNQNQNFINYYKQNQMLFDLED